MPVPRSDLSTKKNRKIKRNRHKTFGDIARRGKGTMGWFYRFILHLVTNFRGETVDAKLTTGNVHDTKPVPDITNKLSGKLYADKGYISKKLSKN